MKQIVTGVLSLFVTIIWWYLLYQILKRVEATELMWFLYWIYLPVSFLINALLNVLKEVDEE